MPAAVRPKCSTCRSEHRGEIERRLIANEAVAKVSDWLKRTHREYISPVGLAAHKRNHIPLVQEAKAKIAEQAQAAIDAGVEKLVADITLLDVIAAHAMDAVKRLQPAMGRPTMPQSAAYTGALREAREAVRQRDEMLGGPKDRQPSGERVGVHVHYPAGIGPIDDGSSPEPTPGAGAPASSPGS